MLTQEDLTNIEGIVERKTHEVFARQFDVSFDRKFDQAFDRKFDQAFDRKFDERFGEQADLIQQGFNELGQRMDLFEFGLKDFRQEFHQTLSGMDRKLDQLLGKYDSDAKKISDLEAEVVSAHVRIDRVETRLGFLKSQQQ